MDIFNNKKVTSSFSFPSPPVMYCGGADLCSCPSRSIHSSIPVIHSYHRAGAILSLSSSWDFSAFAHGNNEEKYHTHPVWSTWTWRHLPRVRQCWMKLFIIHTPSGACQRHRPDRPPSYYDTRLLYCTGCYSKKRKEIIDRCHSKEECVLDSRLGEILQVDQEFVNDFSSCGFSLGRSFMCSSGRGMGYKELRLYIG